METPATLVDGQSTPKPGPQHHHHHHHHSGRRLRQFLHPNGRKVHIASSPDEAEHLRKALSESEKDCEFDLVIHGSPEHIEALKHTHAHHEERQKKFREEHGELVDEFERVIRELDSLSTELHMISEHAVQLDANFSKYGYSAHLRTKESPDASRANSLYGDSDHSFDKDRWSAERKLGSYMRLYQRPIVRQYFHKGLLWRAREAQEVASYELFVDLFYVGIIAISGDSAAEHATGKSLLHFVITFVLGWKFWSDISVLISWVDCDDILRRFSVLFFLTCLLGFTTNMAAAWTETYTSLIAFYLASRFFFALALFWYAWQMPMVRAWMIGNGILTVVPAAFWIASIHVDEPDRQGLIWPAIVFDIFGQTLMVLFQRGGSLLSNQFGTWVKRTFEFIPGTNIEHRIERTGAFVTLVFGYSVIGLLYQSHEPFGINAFFGKAVLGLIQAFTFNWLYFEIDSFNLHTHAIRRHFLSAIAWFSIHLPFILSFVLSASALNKIVLAHDNPNTDEHSLWEIYATRSEHHVSSGQRWFYCGGLGIALASMGIISISHVHKTIPHQRAAKKYRLTFRFLAALVIILLPLAEDRLDSLALVATTCGIVVSVLLVELVGSTCFGDSFWLDMCESRKKCHYSAKCNITKKELDASVKDGTVIQVEELAKKEGGKKGMATV